MSGEYHSIYNYTLDPILKCNPERQLKLPIYGIIFPPQRSKDKTLHTDPKAQKPAQGQTIIHLKIFVFLESCAPRHSRKPSKFAEILAFAVRALGTGDYFGMIAKVLTGKGQRIIFVSGARTMVVRGW